MHIFKKIILIRPGAPLNNLGIQVNTECHIFGDVLLK